MGKIGFGGYRISIKSDEHQRALLHALNAGIKLIDTSANYTNGESEELIGKVLSEHPEFNPIIVTKAGYIQGNNLQLVDDFNLKEDLVIVSEGLNHSIHPHFLEMQLTKSLERLKKNTVDVFLLHNPEYFFRGENQSEVEFYARIKKAFIHLESEVKRGRIKNYGISSNHFILPHSHKEWVSLEKIIEIAKSIGPDHHFTHVQFPLNLIEIGALEKLGDYGELSFLEFAKLNNLTTMINGPLNAFLNNQLIRLATYEELLEGFEDEKAIQHFEFCLNLLEEKWNRERQKENDPEIEDLKDLTIVKQFIEMWNKLPTPDAVEQFYFGHIFPFIAGVWGGGLTVEESRPFYKLLDFSHLYSRKNLDQKAQQFRKQALDVGLIEEDSPKNFAKEVVGTYLNYGIDYVLVGMKKVEYVSQLKDLY